MAEPKQILELEQVEVSDAVIAQTCHEANRVLQAAFGDPVSPPWEELDAETVASALDGVAFARGGATPRESHENWVRFKVRHGWAYGPEKNAEARVHPDLVPYELLPASQKLKDEVFTALVRTLAPKEA